MFSIDVLLFFLKKVRMVALLCCCLFCEIILRLISREKANPNALLFRSPLTLPVKNKTVYGSLTWHANSAERSGGVDHQQ